jgi:hypothetical protein
LIISFQQPITERDANSCENASNIQIIDERIVSSDDHSEINAFSPEMASENVESVSLEDDTINLWKSKKGQWDIGRTFQPGWVSNFHLMNQHLQKMRNKNHKLDAIYVVGNLASHLHFR